MVTDTDDPDTVRIALRIRRCNSRNCGERAVSLEGPEVYCPFCNGGKLRYATGDVQIIEIPKDRVEEIPDSEIVDRSDT